MPKVRVYKAKKHCEKLQTLLMGQIEYANLDYEQVAKIMGVKSDITSLKYVKKTPEELNLKKLSKLWRGLGIPIDDLMAAIRKVITGGA